MKTYQVVLTKSYLITIETETQEQARQYSEFFTGDIGDISSEKDRKKINFSIKEINCKMNESFEVQEIGIQTI